MIPQPVQRLASVWRNLSQGWPAGERRLYATRTTAAPDRPRGAQCGDKNMGQTAGELFQRIEAPAIGTPGISRPICRSTLPVMVTPAPKGPGQTDEARPEPSDPFGGLGAWAAEVATYGGAIWLQSR
jgi:hypothetical protein